ncbi:unnamed protein product [Closterium sp. Yama58-4]|nr:unnamed protein product [Closterium sp. Yama58-4]
MQLKRRTGLGLKRRVSNAAADSSSEDEEEAKRQAAISSVVVDGSHIMGAAADPTFRHKRKAKRGLHSTLASKERRRLRKMEEPKSETVASDQQNAKDASASEEPKTDGNQAPEEPPLKKVKFDPELSLRVKKLSETAVLPKRGSASAAGYDLSSAHDVTVPARGQALVKTDLAIAIPLGTYARVAPRSGLALKHSINVGGGVVDYDYRGNVGVILFNHSDKDFSVKVGDRVAQLILERIVTPDVVEVEELDETTRGAGGFGSTGGSNALKHK